MAVPVCTIGKLRRTLSVKTITGETSKIGPAFGRSGRSHRAQANDGLVSEMPTTTARMAGQIWQMRTKRGGRESGGDIESESKLMCTPDSMGRV